ncbi:MAG TPA: Nif3-like dinuclear metal center hexameric protein [Micromonosporaceae bacterium]
MSATVGDVIGVLDARYPPSLAAEWDRVGLVVGDPDAQAVRVLFVVDCVPETVREAIDLGAGLIVAHHPLLLRGVSSVATTTYKGRIVHDLIRHGIALHVAHTNADCAPSGVAEALAETIGLVDIGPLTGDPERDAGRTGRLPVPMRLDAFAAFVATALPPTGIRAAGVPDRLISRIAVCPGAGDAFLREARAAGVDAYLTADLRHHPASEFLAEPGPALIEASHWATERPWLDRAAAIVGDETGVETLVSDLATDPWTMHISWPGSVGVTGK